MISVACCCVRTWPTVGTTGPDKRAVLYLASQSKSIMSSLLCQGFNHQQKVHFVQSFLDKI